MYFISQPFKSGLWWKGSKKRWITNCNTSCGLYRKVKYINKAFRIFESMPEGSFMLCTKSRKLWEK